jgi:hypothetical protein
MAPLMPKNDINTDTNAARRLRRALVMTFAHSEPGVTIARVSEHSDYVTGFVDRWQKVYGGELRVVVDPGVKHGPA